jgi:hypothetical protein
VSIDAGGSWGGCVLVHAEEPSGLGRRVFARHKPVDRWKRISVREVVDRGDAVCRDARLSGGRADPASPQRGRRALRRRTNPAPRSSAAPPAKPAKSRPVNGSVPECAFDLSAGAA